MFIEGKNTEIFCMQMSFVNFMMRWFFGFKLHLICNEKGGLLSFMITSGDGDDHKLLEHKAFVEFLYGKLVDDKGYIDKGLFQRLLIDGIQLVTNVSSI